MHLAQLNIAKALAPIDSPQLAEFTDNIDRINALAERAPGFIWRLQDESGNATGIQAFDDPDMLVNLSVWKDKQSLQDFVFKTVHKDFLARRQQWFEVSSQPTYVLWRIPVGHIPTLEEAIERLEHLQQHGDSEFAFSFRFRPD